MRTSKDDQHYDAPSKSISTPHIPSNSSSPKNQTSPAQFNVDADARDVKPTIDADMFQAPFEKHGVARALMSVDLQCEDEKFECALQREGRARRFAD